MIRMVGSIIVVALSVGTVSADSTRILRDVAKDRTPGQVSQLLKSPQKEIALLVLSEIFEHVKKPVTVNGPTRMGAMRSFPREKLVVLEAEADFVTEAESSNWIGVRVRARVTHRVKTEYSVDLKPGKLPREWFDAKTKTLRVVLRDVKPGPVEREIVGDPETEVLKRYWILSTSNLENEAIRQAKDNYSKRDALSKLNENKRDEARKEAVKQVKAKYEHLLQMVGLSEVKVVVDIGRDND